MVATAARLRCAAELYRARDVQVEESLLWISSYERQQLIEGGEEQVPVIPNYGDGEDEAIYAVEEAAVPG